MAILPRRIYRDGPHGPVIAGVDLNPEGDRKAGPDADDRKAAPRQTAAKGAKKPPAKQAAKSG